MNCRKTWFCTSSSIFAFIFRGNWRKTRWSSRFYGLMRGYTETRLLSDIGNIFWQSNIAVIVNTYLFVNLTINLSACVIAAPVLPLHLYIFFPSAILLTMAILICALPLLSSIRGKSEMFIQQLRGNLPRLLDADRIVFRHAKRVIRAQRVFGYKVGTTSFVSVGTVQMILSESISYSLLIMSLAKEMKNI